MQLFNEPYQKAILLLTLFVGGLVWLIAVFFIKVFLTNLNGKSIWSKPLKVTERNIAIMQSTAELQSELSQGFLNKSGLN